MSFVRIFYHSILFTLVVFAAAILSLTLQRETMPTKGLASSLTSLWHRRVLRCFNINIHVTGKPVESSCLFICNHTSWLDIAVVGGLVPVHFLAKAEIRDWPVFGWLATKAGTLYIRRGGRKSAEDSIHKMSSCLNQNHNIALFPEGTTTDGTIRKFHSRLFQSAVDTNSIVQPVAIQYKGPKGETVHPAVLYLGDMTSLQSFKNVAGAKEINIEVSFLEPVKINSETRIEIAKILEDRIRQHLKNI